MICVLYSIFYPCSSADDFLKEIVEKFFNSIAPGLNKILEELIENTNLAVLNDPELEDARLEK